jgi:hypothetical protein
LLSFGRRIVSWRETGTAVAVDAAEDASVRGFCINQVHILRRLIIEYRDFHRRVTLRGSLQTEIFRGHIHYCGIIEVQSLVVIG